MFNKRKRKQTKFNKPVITVNGTVTDTPSTTPLTKWYVLGFMFNASHKKVVLIRKKRPDWQKNKLNGVGGKIEGWELPSDAMTREFKEETGVLVPTERWLHVIDMYFDGVVVYVFACSDQKFYDEATTTTDEEIEKTTIWHVINKSNDCVNSVAAICRLSEHALHFTNTNPYENNN